MTTIKSINIPKPCHESWQEMTAVDQGRYCQLCCKTVTDFSIMSNNEIINYLATANNVCGRFDEQQLTDLNHHLYGQTPPVSAWKRWVMMISLMGSTMFFKANAQTKPIKVEQTDGKRNKPILLDTQRIGKVAVYADTSIVFQTKLEQCTSLQTIAGGLVVKRHSFFRRIYDNLIRNPIHKIFN